jgi:hypothetical protein
MASHSTLFSSGKRSTCFSLHVDFVAPDADAGANATEKKKDGPRRCVDRFVVIA